MDKKLFSFDIDEYNGEQEYTHTEYVWAKNLKEAEKLAREYAKDFYEDGQPDGKDQWTLEISYSNIFWTVGSVREVNQVVVYPINSGRLLLDVSSAVIE